MPPDKMVAYRLQGVVTYTSLIKTFANKIKLESSDRRRSRNQDKIQGKKNLLVNNHSQILRRRVTDYPKIKQSRGFTKL